jgi:DNA-binding beta-propeller fold protein YncE
VQGYSGDGGQATSAKLYYPQGIALDSSGNIYFADEENNVIRRITATTGIISTVAGNGTQGYTGDGQSATQAELNQPQGVYVDSSGNIQAITLSVRSREVSSIRLQVAERPVLKRRMPMEMVVHPLKPHYTVSLVSKWTRQEISI